MENIAVNYQRSAVFDPIEYVENGGIIEDAVVKRAWLYDFKIRHKKEEKSLSLGSRILSGESSNDRRG